MGLLPDTQNCGLRMRRECRERLPRHRGLAIPTCIMTRAWHTCRDACRDRLLTVSFEVGGGENVSGVPGACATRNFAYLVRGPWQGYIFRITAPVCNPPTTEPRHKWFPEISVSGSLIPYHIYRNPHHNYIIIRDLCTILYLSTKFILFWDPMIREYCFYTCIWTRFWGIPVLCWYVVTLSRPELSRNILPYCQYGSVPGQICLQHDSVVLILYGHSGLFNH